MQTIVAGGSGAPPCEGVTLERIPDRKARIRKVRGAEGKGRQGSVASGQPCCEAASLDGGQRDRRFRKRGRCESHPKHPPMACYQKARGDGRVKGPAKRRFSAMPQKNAPAAMIAIPLP